MGIEQKIQPQDNDKNLGSLSNLVLLPPRSKEPFEPPIEKLTAIIITKNEEKNIARCLSSLNFVEEIIIIDSGSTDKTLEIARGFHDVKIIKTEWFGFVENKQIAIKKATFNWILWIDADEVVTKELKEEWINFRNRPENFHDIGGMSVPRKTFFLGQWVRYSGWYPNRITRFFHKNRSKFNNNILHEGVEINQGYYVYEFKNNILHYSYTSLLQYFDKMNKYGLTGAQEAYRKNKKFFFLKLVLEPFWTFLRFYFLKKGFLDGKLGFIVCMGAAFSNFIRYTNYYYLKERGGVNIHASSKKD